MKTFKQFLENEELQTKIPIGGFGGWKIHLRTGPVEDNRNTAYKYVLKIIEEHGNKWKSKKLSGGDPNDKDITIYCGPKKEAEEAAIAIKNNIYLYNMLFPPTDDMLKDDIQILPNVPKVLGRFVASILNTKPATFHQYGCKGWSMLNSYMEKQTLARNNKQPFDKEDACKKSYMVLKKLFGKDFTG
jgi:hypothetical protein